LELEGWLSCWLCRAVRACGVRLGLVGWLCML